ncbi:MAG: choice-of-anchor V domain-containing protein [Bacteroidota bacterium]
MKSKITLITLIFITGLLLIMLSGNNVFSDETGAPAMVSGSPYDGQTCAKSSCHTGNAVIATPGIITSTIPASGYVSGYTYTISATLTQTGNSCWGFEISPQSATGTLMGTPVITNTTTTQIKSTKYITHKLAGITGANTKTWNFDWVAPAAGTGNVTFYGAFNYCNGNGSKTGDFIHTSSTTVNEFVSGVAEKNNAEKTFSVYPNPVQYGSQFSVYLNEPSDIKMNLMSLNGSVTQLLCDEKQVSGSYIYEFNRQDVKPGLYIVRLITSAGITAKKIVIL